MSYLCVVFIYCSVCRAPAPAKQALRRARKHYYVGNLCSLKTAGEYYNSHSIDDIV